MPKEYDPFLDEGKLPSFIDYASQKAKAIDALSYQQILNNLKLDQNKMHKSWAALSQASLNQATGDAAQFSVPISKLPSLIEEGLTLPAKFTYCGYPVSTSFSTKSEPEQPRIPMPKDMIYTPDKRKTRAKEGMATPEPETIVSHYRKMFPSSKKEQWTCCHPIGWIHESEQYDFMQEFFHCEGTKAWHPRKERVRTISEEFVCKKYAEEHLVIDACSGFYGPKEDMVQFVNVEPDGMGFTWKGNTKTHLMMDVFDGKLHRKNSCILVKGKVREGGNLISQPTASSGKYHTRCCNCSNWYEKEFEAVKPRPGFYTDPVCDTCYVKLVKAKAIGPYNDKHFPPAIFSEVTLNHVVMGSSGVISSNHHKKRKYIDPRLFGIELELEFYRKGLIKLGLNRVDMAVQIRQTMGDDYVSIKEDGTLTTNGKYDGDGAFDPTGQLNGQLYAGFEVVTAPASIEIHREKIKALDLIPAAMQWEKIGGGKSKLIRAWDTLTCGMHVHVTREALTNLQIGRILTFVNSPKNKRFMQHCAGRAPQKKGFAYIEKKPSDCFKKDPDKYTAINLYHDSTVEFRVFRGTARWQHVIRNVEFVDAICDFCAPCNFSLADMHNYKLFIEFVDERHKDWPELYRWMMLHEMIKPRGEAAKLMKKGEFDLPEHELVSPPPPKDEHDDIKAAKSKKPVLVDSGDEEPTDDETV